MQDCPFAGEKVLIIITGEILIGSHEIYSNPKDHYVHFKFMKIRKDFWWREF